MPQNTSNNSVRHKFAWFLLKSFISPPCPAKVLKSRGGKEPDTSRSYSSPPLTSGLTLTWVTPLCTAVPLSVEWGWKPGRTLDKTCEALSPCSARNPRSAKRQPLSSSPSRLKNSLPKTVLRTAWSLKRLPTSGSTAVSERPQTLCPERAATCDQRFGVTAIRDHHPLPPETVCGAQATVSRAELEGRDPEGVCRRNLNTPRSGDRGQQVPRRERAGGCPGHAQTGELAAHPGPSGAAPSRPQEWC